VIFDHHVLGFEARAADEQRRALHHVAELSHVARPIVSEKLAERTRRNRRYGLSRTRAELAQEMPR
jgi:hypothetical protein